MQPSLYLQNWQTQDIVNCMFKHDLFFKKPNVEKGYLSNCVKGETKI